MNEIFTALKSLNFRKVFIMATGEQSKGDYEVETQAQLKRLGTISADSPTQMFQKLKTEGPVPFIRGDNPRKILLHSYNHVGGAMASVFCVVVDELTASYRWVPEAQLIDKDCVNLIFEYACS